VTALLRDLVNRSAVDVGSRRIKASGEGAAHCFDVPVARGVENAFVGMRRECDAVDVRLHCTPILEAVVASDRKLSVMESGIGLFAAQFHEPVLRGFPQPFEIGLGRQSIGHDVPSFAVIVHGHPPSFTTMQSYSDAIGTFSTSGAPSTLYTSTVVHYDPWVRRWYRRGYRADYGVWVRAWPGR
jgi:hypothetical protein